MFGCRGDGWVARWDERVDILWHLYAETTDARSRGIVVGGPVGCDFAVRPGDATVGV